MAKTLTETPQSAPASNVRGTILVEDVTHTTFEVIEEAAAEGKPKKFKMRGEFGLCDEATANKRLYRKELWEREIKRLDKAIKERRVYGELDHPSDGQTSLNRVSHILTDLRIEGNKVYGELEALDTVAGKNLQALAKAGCKLGVSSRGYGSVKPTAEGIDIVQDDFMLKSFDVVADPAAGAFPETVLEAKQQEEAEVESQADAVQAIISEEIAKAITARETELEAEFEERLRAEKAEATRLAEEATKLALKEEVSREILAYVASLKTEAVEQAKQELATDPEIAGAKLALEAVKDILLPYILPEDAATHLEKVQAESKASEEALRTELADRDLKIKDLEAKAARLESVAREAGYRYFVEKTLAADPDAEMIRKLVGDVTDYASLSDLQGKIDAIRADLEKKREEVAKAKQAAKKAKRAAEEAQAKIAAEKRRAEEARREAAAERARLEESVEERLEAEFSRLERLLEQERAEKERLSLKLYAERRLTGHPRAAKIREVLEAMELTSREQVDGVVARFREPARELDEDTGDVRARIRRFARAGSGPKALDEETPAKPRMRRADWIGNELGIDLGESLALAGVKPIK